MNPAAPTPVIPPLHVIVPGSILRREDFPEAAARLFEAGGEALALHLRAPELPGRPLFRRARMVARLAAERGGWCVVNGRVDVARAAGAQGVQLGRSAPPLSALRPWLGTLRVGVSVHGVRAARRAAEDGANHLVVGTVYATPSHPGRPGAGPERIERVRRGLAAAGSPLPLVAIGGIDPARVAEARAAGAHGVAVQRAVWEAAEPGAAVERLLAALADAPLDRAEASGPHGARSPGRGAPADGHGGDPQIPMSE